ncbi:MAG: hypothetical protein PF447_04350 [Spirochaetaceae bacterium]|jgi:sugar-specific transcriptional regulator TrmB|nr:hypothetical protein [Spirochaetaceae bacterium]
MVVNSRDVMMKLGFSQYETRAYLALLKKHPLTAYETARQSKVPNPKIYGVLDRLEERGMVQIIERAGKKKYLPMDPGEFIFHQRSITNSQLDQQETSLQEEIKDNSSDYVWNINDIGEFQQRVNSLIQSAEDNILISLWAEETIFCRDALEEAENRDVKLAMVHFGPAREGLPGMAYEHPIAETLFKEKGGRSFCMVVDSSVAIMGLVDLKGSPEASWSRSMGFTSLAEDYIRHDIYLMKIVQRLDSPFKDLFGDGYPLLRNVFDNKEISNG